MQLEQKNYSAVFMDAENRLFRVKIELRPHAPQGKTDWENKPVTYPYYSLGVTSQTGQGQFKPANPHQRRLLDLWNDFHLNDCTAGTKAQMELLASEGFRAWKAEQQSASDYDVKKRYCELKGLSTPVYGSKWWLRPLPQDIEAQIEQIISGIQEQESLRISALADDIAKQDEEYDFSDVSLEDFADSTLDYAAMESVHNAIIAVCEGKDELAKQQELEKRVALGLSVAECISDLEVQDENMFDYGGENYLVCTDDEADDEQDKEHDHYIEECILPEIPKQYHKYFDEAAWKSDAKDDGRGHCLNRYDGEEYEKKVLGTVYFIYQQ